MKFSIHHFRDDRFMSPVSAGRSAWNLVIAGAMLLALLLILATASGSPPEESIELGVSAMGLMGP